VRKLLLSLVVAAVCLLPFAIRADWDVDDFKWAQLPDRYGWDVNLTSPIFLADDFLCRDSDPITDIHLWGSWKDDLVGEITRIHLSIHADIPASASHGPGYSTPGEVLWERDFFPDRQPNLVKIREWFQEGPQGWMDPMTGEFIPQNHNQIWQINVLLPEPDIFEQEGSLDNPIVYWLDVQIDVAPVTGGPQPEFGWKTSLNHWNDDAVWGCQTVSWQELIDPFTEESLDMAFAITSGPIVPEPGVFFVSGVGVLLAMVIVRRRK
jgi:hypothetical protein